MNHFLTSLDWSRTCPLQLFEKRGDLGLSPFFCSGLFGFSQRYGIKNNHLAMKFFEFAALIIHQPMYRKCSQVRCSLYY